MYESVMERKQHKKVWGRYPQYLYSSFTTIGKTNNIIYYMANPVLGKSLCSDWFFLGQDFAARTVSMETVQPVYFVLERSRQIQNLQPKLGKKL